MWNLELVTQSGVLGEDRVQVVALVWVFGGCFGWLLWLLVLGVSGGCLSLDCGKVGGLSHFPVQSDIAY